jgi:hypothetical protein
VAKEPNFISHWDQLFENFQTSSVEFYNAVEKAVAERSVPEAHWTRVEHKEGGLASANRQYLRMHRGKHAFDICAAPFGNGFFVSWWLTEPPLRFGFLYTLAILFGVFICFNIAYGLGAAIGAAMSGLSFGIMLGGCFAFIGVPLLLWLIGNGLRQGVIAGESTVLAIPIIGWIYERVFAPTTYYSMDTAIMFQKSIHQAVLEVVDGMTAAKGVRALSEFERKPVMKSMSASA